MPNQDDFKNYKNRKWLDFDDYKKEIAFGETTLDYKRWIRNKIQTAEDESDGYVQRN